ncbi:hypothetical protein SRABI83_03115 [Arthrobacter sp. Bi83]|uniref:hypothetical protein n=1 Tax=Arthrobacter sp. Bi83 TaxID=2822353 RepID=UPI001D986382|nr:hypothetical protein [Arthrobacter sp. Bi83]CAH0250722.1 hypothetical protein SRABI83_03115 [Arthrobacter sp. Bi83]
MTQFTAEAPATSIRAGRLSGFLSKTLSRARTAAIPYKIGDAVVGDDPFNGRREGIVELRNGNSVGLRSSGRVYFYDYRQLRRPE